MNGQLNDKAIAGLAPGKVYFFAGVRAQGNTAPRGFGVKVTPAGCRSFVLRYSANGKDRLMVIEEAERKMMRTARDYEGYLKPYVPDIERLYSEGLSYGEIAKWLCEHAADINLVGPMALGGLVRHILRPNGSSNYHQARSNTARKQRWTCLLCEIRG
jgi:hypothetical protein